MSECHHLQNEFYSENNLNQTFEALLFHLDPLLIPIFFYSVTIFLFESALSMNPTISDL